MNDRRRIVAPVARMLAPPEPGHSRGSYEDPVREGALDRVLEIMRDAGLRYPFAKDQIFVRIMREVFDLKVTDAYEVSAYRPGFGLFDRQIVLAEIGAWVWPNGALARALAPSAEPSAYRDVIAPTDEELAQSRWDLQKQRCMRAADTLCEAVSQLTDRAVEPWIVLAPFLLSPAQETAYRLHGLGAVAMLLESS